jgi:hypothetical protein
MLFTASRVCELASYGRAVFQQGIQSRNISELDALLKKYFEDDLI